MKTKFLFILFACTLLLQLNVNISSAQESGMSSSTATKRAEKQSDRTNHLKTKANEEITRRITALQNLTTKISLLKRLTADQKLAFTNQIQTEITNLTALKAKIAQDTDLSTLQADVKSIMSSYRIYALFIPKIHILVTSEKMNEIIAQMEQLEAKLATRIQEAKTRDKDTTTLQVILSDMQTSLQDAKTQSQNAQNTVLSLTPEGYPDNKTALENAREMLQKGQKDLQTARQSAKTISQGLQSFNNTAPSAGTNSTEQ